MVTTKQKYSLSIEQSDDRESPREWENCSKMVLMHGRYDLPYETELFSKGYLKSLENWGAVKKELVHEHGIYPSCIKPVYMYDHGGITVSTISFECGWDSGQVGYIFVDKNTMKKEEITKKNAILSIDYELNTYDQYLNGDVWGVVIRDEAGEVVDSEYGLYGYEYAECSGNRLIAYWNK